MADLEAIRQRLDIVERHGHDDAKVPVQWYSRDVTALFDSLEHIESILRGLVDAVAGEQWAEDELAKALGKEVPYWIARARGVLGEKE